MRLVLASLLIACDHPAVEQPVNEVPAPIAVDAAPPDAPSPPVALRARVQSIHVVAGGIEITAERGSDDGVTVAWHGFLDKPRVPCAIARVNHRTTACVVNATFDQAPVVKFIWIEPP